MQAVRELCHYLSGASPHTQEDIQQVIFHRKLHNFSYTLSYARGKMGICFLEDFLGGLSKLSDIHGTKSRVDGENSILARPRDFAAMYLFQETCKKSRYGWMF